MATGMRPKLRVKTCHHLWLVTILASALSSCSSDSTAINTADGRSDDFIEKAVATDREDVRAAAAIIDDFFVSDPSPSEPVTAAMKIRPENAIAGETVEILVYARIAPGHYLHAASDPGDAFACVAVKLTLPEGVEASSDWRYPTPDNGQNNAPVYRNSILLRRSLTVRAHAPPQDLLITAELHYQACTDELCWPPQLVKLSTSFAIRSNRR